MSTKFSCSTTGDTGTIQIRDDIGPEWAGMISDETIVPYLDANPDLTTIQVWINSAGGDCNIASAIYNALRRHGAFIDVVIDGLAASAASQIAMAGDRISIAANALLMIHRCWSVVSGNEADLAAHIPIMKKIDNYLCDTYAERSGQPKAQVRQWMNAETWFDASEAVKYGFADVIGADSVAKASVAKNRYRNTPRNLIDSSKSFPKREDADARIDRIVSDTNARPSVAKAERRIEKLLQSVGS